MNRFYHFGVTENPLHE